MRLKHLVAATVLASTVLAFPAFGQEGQPAGSTMRQAQLTPQPHIITIDFDGGTLAKLVDELKSASSHRPVNVIYSSEAADISVPPFEVRDAELYSTLQSLSYASSGSPMKLDDGRIVSWDIARVGDGVYSVYLEERLRQGSPGTQQFGPPHRYTVVHAITELISGANAMQADQVLSALQAALAMEDGGEVKLAYHEDTGLIFARVTSDQGSVIEQTLMHLERSMHARQRGKSNSQMQRVLEMTDAKTAEELVERVRSTNDLRARVVDLQRTIAELQDHIIRLQAELDRRDAVERDRGR